MSVAPIERSCFSVSINVESYVPLPNQPLPDSPSTPQYIPNVDCINFKKQESKELKKKKKKQASTIDLSKVHINQWVLLFSALSSQRHL